MRIYFIILIAFFTVSSVFGQDKTSNKNKDNVIAQMNYCMNSLVNIIHNKSMIVLEHELDQLVNNLTMEQIIGLYEINDFRTELIDAVGKFGITEEERNVMRRVQSIKRDNMKWAALSNSLDQTMLLTGNGSGFGPQMAFQILLTAARSVVEYKTMQGEQNIEELQAMWDLRKEDLQTIIDLRKKAQSTIFELYDKYNLNESDRLTESTALLFNEYITEANPAKRVRILQDNYKTYCKFPEYYYHLGMAHIDCKNYAKAKQSFITYLNMYKNAPILRYDERTGCIALTILTYEKGLSSTEKEELIDTAIKNLPSNSAAILQCAMIYIKDLKNFEKGFQLIRAGIDDPKATDRDVLFMAAANLIPCLNNKSITYNSICESFCNSYVSLDSYLTFNIYTNKNAWKSINNVLLVNNVRPWYLSFLFGDKKFNNEFQITVPGNISFNGNDILVYIEEHKYNKLIIKQMSQKYLNAISDEDISDVDCFKANKNLKYLFVETIIPGVYKLKDNIDIDKIKDETYPRLSEFNLPGGDIEDIVEFCLDFKRNEKNTNILFELYNGPKESVISKISKIVKQDPLFGGMLSNALDKYLLDEITFIGDSLSFKPYHTKAQEGSYVRIVLQNGLQIMFKYNENTNELEPYLYTKGKEFIYANPTAKSEYTYKENDDNKELKKQDSTDKDDKSWYSKMWNSIFSSDNESKYDDNKELKKQDSTDKDDESWYSKMWNSIFSSDNESKKEDSQATEKR